MAVLSKRTPPLPFLISYFKQKSHVCLQKHKRSGPLCPLKNKAKPYIICPMTFDSANAHYHVKMTLNPQRTSLMVLDDRAHHNEDCYICCSGLIVLLHREDSCFLNQKILTIPFPKLPQLHSLSFISRNPLT